MIFDTGAKKTVTSGFLAGVEPDRISGRWKVNHSTRFGDGAGQAADAFEVGALAFTDQIVVGRYFDRGLR